MPPAAKPLRRSRTRPASGAKGPGGGVLRDLRVSHIARLGEVRADAQQAAAQSATLILRSPPARPAARPGHPRQRRHRPHPQLGADRLRPGPAHRHPARHPHPGRRDPDRLPGGGWTGPRGPRPPAEPGNVPLL